MSDPIKTATDATWLGLEGRVCAVTGAGSGIGAAIATELARAGARVALLDRDGAAAAGVARAIAAQGGTALALECDVSREASVREAAAGVRRELGDCGVLVNNAGMLRPGALEGVSLQEWNAVLAVNLTGALLCAQAFRPQLQAAGQGSLVHVASIAALHPQTRSGAYSASKAGVLLLSRQLAAEWGPLGLRSNAICPGMIRTPLSARFYEEPGFEARRAAVTACRRVGEPLDIANAALFLASPRSAYLNGAELVVLKPGRGTRSMSMVSMPPSTTSSAPLR